MIQHQPRRNSLGARVPVALLVVAGLTLGIGVVRNAPWAGGGADALPSPEQMAALGGGRDSAAEIVELWDARVDSSPESSAARAELAQSLMQLASDTGDLTLYAEAETEARSRRRPRPDVRAGGARAHGGARGPARLYGRRRPRPRRARPEPGLGRRPAHPRRREPRAGRLRDRKHPVQRGGVRGRSRATGTQPHRSLAGADRRHRTGPRRGASRARCRGGGGLRPVNCGVLLVPARYLRVPDRALRRRSIAHRGGTVDPAGPPRFDRAARQRLDRARGARCRNRALRRSHRTGSGR